MPSYSQEDWGQFFTRHFTSSAFNGASESRPIDIPDFHQHKNDYVSQLRQNVKGSPHIHVPFHDLPECRSDSLSSHLEVKEGVRRKHVSLLLAQLTLKELLGALREDAGNEKAVHIDFGRKPANEEESASPSSSATRKMDGFFTLSFKDIANAMAHFGTLLPDWEYPGIRNIPGLKVTADLSGLKMEDPAELPHLHNLLVRSTITSLHTDLSLIKSSHQIEAWGQLANTLSTPSVKYLRHLTVNLATQDTNASSFAADKLADALKQFQSEDKGSAASPRGDDEVANAQQGPSSAFARATAFNNQRGGSFPVSSSRKCHLESLTLIGGNWTKDDTNKLLNAWKERHDLGGPPVNITINGKKLELPTQ